MHSVTNSTNSTSFLIVPCLCFNDLDDSMRPCHLMIITWYNLLALLLSTVEQLNNRIKFMIQHATKGGRCLPFQFSTLEHTVYIGMSHPNFTLRACKSIVASERLANLTTLWHHQGISRVIIQLFCKAELSTETCNLTGKSFLSLRTIFKY